jgi:hypothetical protein
MTADDFVAVLLPSDLYQELAKRHPGAAAGIVADQVASFLDRTEEDFYGPAKRGTGGQQGVFWEALFLPTGTQFRIRYFGKYQEGKLEGEDFIYKDKKYSSVSQMASAMRGNTSVNAWRYIEVKRPGDSAWHLALRLRRSRSSDADAALEQLSKGSK